MIEGYMCNAFSVRLGIGVGLGLPVDGLAHPHHHHTWPLPTGLSQPPHLPPHLSTPSHAYLHTYLHTLSPHLICPGALPRAARQRQPRACRLRRWQEGAPTLTLALTITVTLTLTLS
eukprot:scaffold108505_cov36-Phaeocystis_antarctica.AAC.1